MSDVGEESESERKDKAWKRLSQDRQNADREKMAEERRAHLENLAREARGRNDELEMLMGELEEPEKRQIRLHAAVLGYSQGWVGENDRQASLDSAALKLARYAVLGQT